MHGLVSYGTLHMCPYALEPCVNEFDGVAARELLRVDSYIYVGNMDGNGDGGPGSQSGEGWTSMSPGDGWECGFGDCCGGGGLNSQDGVGLLCEDDLRPEHTDLDYLEQVVRAAEVRGDRMAIALVDPFLVALRRDP